MLGMVFMMLPIVYNNKKFWNFCSWVTLNSRLLILAADIRGIFTVRTVRKF